MYVLPQIYCYGGLSESGLPYQNIHKSLGSSTKKRHLIIFHIKIFNQGFKTSPDEIVQVYSYLKPIIKQVGSPKDKLNAGSP